MKIQTQSDHFKADSTLLAFVDAKMAKLDRFFEGIMDANIVLKLENTTDGIKDKVTEVKMNLPGCVLYVKETSKTFEASVDGAIFALSSHLSKYQYLKNKLQQKQRA